MGDKSVRQSINSRASIRVDTIENHKTGRKLSVFSMVLLSATALSSPAFAQNSASPSSSTSVDEIIVTTQGFETLRKNNVGNIAVLSTQNLPSIYPSDFLNRAPGVNIHRGNGQEHLTSIRSPVLTGGAGAGSFLYLEDGIPFRAAGFANVNALMDAMPSDNLRVEVVRGPGSALYGSNAVHGMLNFISNPPETKNKYAVTFGSYGRYNLNASAGIATAENEKNTRVSISLSGEESGYRMDSGFAQQKLRLQHRWQNASGQYQFNIAGMNLNQETAGYVNGLNSYKDRDLAKQNAYGDDAFRDATSLRSSLAMQFNLDSGATLRLTPYFRTNDMRFGMHFLPGEPVEENSHTSFGLLSAYTTDLETGSLTLGIDSEWTQGELSEMQNKDRVFSSESGLHYDYEVDATVIAPFAHYVVSAGKNTDITLGLRAEYTEYDYDNQTDDGNFGTRNRFFRPSDRNDDYTDISPKLGIVHRASSDTTLFANLSRGSRAPQTTDLYRLRVGQTVGDIDSETLDSLELGMRGTRGAVNFELAAYTMEKENFYFRDSANNNVSNGETSHVGIELDADWTVNDTLSILGSVAYGKHEYSFSHNPIGNSAPENIIVDGDTMPSAPELLGNVRVEWTPAPTSVVTLEWQHSDDYYLTPGALHDYEGHDLVHFESRYTMNSGTMITARINNLFDTKYAKRANYNTLSGSERYFPGEPRHFYLGVSGNF